MCACSRGFARSMATLAKKAESCAIEVEHQELILEAVEGAGWQHGDVALK